MHTINDSMLIRLLARYKKSGLMVALMLMLSACATSLPVDTPSQQTVLTEDSAVVDGKALPLPDQPILRAETIDEAGRASPVVSRLMASAQQQRRDNQWDAASGSLERALRIEPRNAHLWSILAEVKFDQRDWRSAIQVAAKSNTLSGSNVQLRRRNWYLMANAYDELGDIEAAARFRKKLI